MTPKSIAVMLLDKKRKTDAGDEEEEAGEEPSMPPLEEVMREFLDAVKADDAKGAAKAFRGAMACSEGDEDSEDEE